MSRSLEKLGKALKFSSSSRHRDKSNTTFSNSLSIFRSKVSDFISQNLLNPKPGSKFLSLEHFSKCFELIHVTNRAFAEFALELDYPTSQWGSKATEEHLSYTSILLDMLNWINSSISGLKKAIKSSLSSLGEIKSPVKILRMLNPVKEFGFKRSIIAIEKSAVSDEKESLILEASMLCKKTGLLALGMILSALCSDAKPYLEIRENAGGFNDQEIKALDLKFIASMREMEGFVKEVEALNVAMDCAGSKECANEVKTRIGALEGSLNAIEKNASTLFSEVLSERNELMDHLRMMANKH